LSAQTKAEAQEHLSLGSLIRLWSEPYFCNLICAPQLLSVLKQLGANDIRFSNGFLFSKPPGSPATFWHQDWWLWDEEISFERQASQVGALIYLEPTSPTNGCLRVIPNSHMKFHKLHELQHKYETKELRKYEDPAAAPFLSFPEEVEVPVNPGDVVLFDARLLHSAHANSSGERRNALTFWYFPNYIKLSAAIRAGIGTSKVPDQWPQSYSEMLSPLLPQYLGQAEPATINCMGAPRN
jgi:ectoine hydroxylase-related dioxygenase (phytanoyl-CoA dioxygenase family)